MFLKINLKTKKILTTFVLMACSFLGLAQDATDTDVNAKNFSTGDSKIGTFLKSDDKMTAVIVVISILLVGLFLYLYRLDKKIDKLK